MPRQDALRHFGAIVAAAAKGQIRSAIWFWMAAIMLVAAAVVRFTPIPFWTASVTHGTVLAANVGIAAITCCCAVLYDVSAAWSASLPIGTFTASAANLVGRLIVACATATLGAAAQGALFAIGPSAGPGGAAALAVSAALVSTWTIAVLLPWSALARAALGPAAAPWALLAIVTLTAWLPSPQKLAPIGWVMPLLPSEGASGFLHRPESWLYAVAHAAAITMAGVPFARRMIPRF